MIKQFLDLTDMFLCNSVRDIFEKVEDKHRNKNVDVNISQELKNFEANPLTCVVGCDTKFETNIKLQVKMMLGIFFVAIPLLGFLALSYILGMPSSYAFVFTFIVAMLATSRIDEIAKRYVSTRAL
ncbi:hypothetical protein SMGD1_1769 [Sulfurimonas gotlandica GD1]|uniref:Uncharacterized protein n=1 Tax=Sulfurimonas gotlandica (strain DSM 19862 / JCM 16533 / GD1) TaxID=929558 RepID=B6BID9_SULGG|nr:hypothetical protein [Sulfurimonas gotlandica]EDZ62893.1 hypothetical protein CBGD1_511 [Sulfurimonas gotlandica GD1]EHP30292.1 hypothetical protein SMGD1_1769 [Sulfurimonas gotlandica GD1]